MLNFPRAGKKGVRRENPGTLVSARAGKSRAAAAELSWGSFSRSAALSTISL